ncbi:hypothetical protein EZ313_05230 [Ramlibacter henchirensis]|uniref:Outer membrane protein assembly factor BamE n=1 Tax=Ramlibacter henchirensis TaxID=204072 RepID=A0A4Z0C547_9BURK|nr:hypothetical protein [Ramlibacter henchirensis]TFZ06052.1 hypothetical protein EZ313_05230 [Ramlibacter henchirensis]
MRAASVLLCCGLLAGCAGPLPLATGEQQPRFRDPALSVEQAAQWLAPGRTTRQEVLDRLGPGEAVRFGTGFEVHVWRARARDDRTVPELVVLFDPAGVVHKVRARPAYGPGSR